MTRTTLRPAAHSRTLRVRALVTWVLAALAWASTASPAGAQVVCGPSAASSHLLWTAADVDGDRRIDWVGVSGGSRVPDSGVRVLSDRCASGRAPLLGPTAQGDTLAARDLDADHDLDLVREDAFGVPTQVWLNDGTGRFAQASVALAGPTPPARPALTATTPTVSNAWPLAGSRAIVSAPREAMGDVTASAAARPAPRSRPLARPYGPAAARGPPARRLLHA